MEKLKNKILNLSLKEKIIYTIIFSLVLLVFNYGFFRNKYDNSINSYTSELDYETITYDELITEFNESYSNRDIYLIISNLIEKMKSNYQTNRNIFKEYYDCVDPLYSKVISKSEFSKRMVTIFDSIINSDYKIKMYSEQYYDSVFLIEIYNSDNLIIGKMGFVFDFENAIYSIFWIEQ